MLKKIINTSNSTFNWLIPKRCMVCATKLAYHSHPCCLECYAQLPFQHHCCSQCGQVFSSNLDYCGRCLFSPPPFDACFCPFRYEGLIKEHIQKFKYHDKPELSVILAEALHTEILAFDLPFPDLLIPVPMHINRLRERGYNQASLLAKSLAKLTNTPMSNKVVRKKFATKPQVNQSLRARKNNVKGSFYMPTQNCVKSIAIVDDVVTTGSTAAEITKILKRNGVDYVQVWGLAHTN